MTMRALPPFLLALFVLAWAQPALPKAVTSPPPIERSTRTAFGLDKCGLAVAPAGRALKDLGAGFTPGRVMLNASGQMTAAEIDALDSWVESVQDLGLEPLLSLSPGPGGAYGDTAQYPASERAWLEFVRFLVERYDGDGRDDAPGLRSSLRHWKLLQEWPISWTGTVDEYLRLLDLTYATVKATDPRARIITVGVASRIADAMVLRANGVTRLTEAELEAVQACERILRQGRYDIADLHTYESRCVVDAKIAALRAFMPAGTGIFILQAGGPFRTRAQGYTDAQNAEMVVKLHAQALGSGAARVVWALAPPRKGGYWDYEPWTLMPLLKRKANGSHQEKPSYYSYRLMTRTLAGSMMATDLSSASGAPLAGRTFAYRFRRLSGHTYVLWCDRGGSFAIQTSSKALRVTPAVVGADGKEPPSRMQPVVNGQAVIPLTAAPVYVEAPGPYVR